MPARTSAPIASPGFCCLARRFSESPDMPCFMAASWLEDETRLLTLPMTSSIWPTSLEPIPSWARKESEPRVFRKESKVSCPVSARERRSSLSVFREPFSVVSRASQASEKERELLNPCAASAQVFISLQNVSASISLSWIAWCNLG